ncbi:MAG: arginase, partial [Mesorhizobium sp.]
MPIYPVQTARQRWFTSANQTQKRKEVMRCRIVGAPVQDGAGRMGCEMGP